MKQPRTYKELLEVLTNLDDTALNCPILIEEPFTGDLYPASINLFPNASEEPNPVFQFDVDLSTTR